MVNESKYSDQKEKNKVDKEFKLTSLSLKNRTSVIFLTLLITVMGLMAYIEMPKDSYPEIKQSIVYVGTPYPGNSPVDIEKRITREIEKEMNAISSGVDEIISTSVQDYSTVIVKFTPDVEVDNALRKVKDALDRAKSELPDDLPQDPNASEMDLSALPIMNINLSGDYDLEELQLYAEYLQDEIEKISEVSKADIRGVDEKEIKIKANPYMMEARNVNFGDIENAVKTENLTLSGGSILNGGLRRSVRVVGEFTIPEQMGDIVIKKERGNIVYLKDVAVIEFDYKERESYAHLNGKPVVTVDVVKRSGENILTTTEKINEILLKAKADVFPKNLDVTITNDQSSFVEEMVSGLENNIISGVIVVVFVLLLFFGTRNALFVGMAIPMSMFISFLILNALGITVNIMVLFALIMALGMLVDNGIVVVENIYRLREEGYSLLNATRLGVGEVALPIISSTATTLAAFLPLAIWPGIIGEFMKFLPITLIIALGSSLFVALVINPVFISLFMKLESEVQTNKRKIWIISGISLAVSIVFIILGLTVLGNVIILFVVLTLLNIYVLIPSSKSFQKNILPHLEKKYAILVSKALHRKNPIWIFTGTVFTLLLSFGLMEVFPPNVIFFPINQPHQMNVFIEFPMGTDIEETKVFTERLETRIDELLKPYDKVVESIVTTVGKGAGDPNNPNQGSGETPHKARITVGFVNFKYREGISTSDVLDEVREGVRGYAGVSITVDKDAAGPPSGKPISLEIVGDDFITLVEIAEDMKRYINESGIRGIEGLKLDMETNKPEIVIDIDREKTRRFGLSTYTVANEIRTALFGREVSRFKQKEDEYKIQLRLSDVYRYDIGVLMDKQVTFRNMLDGRMRQVPISSVAQERLSSTYGSVNRKDLTRMVTLNSNVVGGFNATQVNDQIKDILQNFSLPDGYYFKFGGEQEKQAEELAFLSRALIFAIFLIFLIIVAQFNQIIAPFIIMSSVLFSTIGVFMGLIIFRMDFVIIMTMIGIISLAGVVVNNAIVLIDFIELKKRRLKKRLGLSTLPMDQLINTIIDAGKTRFRPVLLTAITTILGLIPLAIGLNIDFLKGFSEYDFDFYMGGDNVIFWGPLSWTIIFGLFFATFLTLVVVPVMYLLLQKISRKIMS